MLPVGYVMLHLQLRVNGGKNEDLRVVDLMPSLLPEQWG